MSKPTLHYAGEGSYDLGQNFKTSLYQRDLHVLREEGNSI